MIEKLDERVQYFDIGDFPEIEGPPTIPMIVEKLNELIEAFNQIEKKIEKLQVL